jgi:predicted trehalose synthase
VDFRLPTASGAVTLTDARLRVVDGSGGAARAGSGVGAELAAMVLGGHPPLVDAGTARVVTAGPARASGAGVERDLGVDMTNWAVVVDEAFLVKVVRDWGGAERSVRQLDRLAAAGADFVPRTAGRIEWTVPGLGTGTVAVVSEYVAGASDGWTWAVDDLLEHLGGGPVPLWPGELGELTARLHLALAADVSPEPSSPAADLQSRVHDALDRAAEVAAGDTSVRLANRMPALRSLADTLPDTAAGRLIPVHGDLHVGQFLRVPDAGTPRYLVVDLDGDPQTVPASLLADELEPAAVDVAHLLVSVDLVGSIAQRRLGRADARATAWAAEARAQLLAAYRAALHDAGADDLLDERLLPALEVEQFARELSYAARFLPRWNYAPDAGITARYAPTADREDPPWTPPASPTT